MMTPHMMNAASDMMNAAWPMMVWMVVGTTLWILLLAGLIWAMITWLNRRWGRPQPHQDALAPTGLSAREILEQRYAHGEIDQATFQQMREQLGAARPY